MVDQNHTHFFTPSQLHRQIGEGGSLGAYYSQVQAICNDESSIKNGSVVQLTQ